MAVARLDTTTTRQQIKRPRARETRRNAACEAPIVSRLGTRGRACDGSARARAVGGHMARVVVCSAGARHYPPNRNARRAERRCTCSSYSTTRDGTTTGATHARMRSVCPKTRARAESRGAFRQVCQSRVSQHPSAAVKAWTQRPKKPIIPTGRRLLMSLDAPVGKQCGERGGGDARGGMRTRVVSMAGAQATFMVAGTVDM
eukprot:2149160-Prymnesium_polylepis.3